MHHSPALTWPPPARAECAAYPLETYLTEEWRARGFGLRAELEAKDDHHNNLTARQRRRLHRTIPCPTCNHHPPATPIFNKDAWLCRWGHETSYMDARNAGLLVRR